MTTARSPLSALQAQADKIAKALKAIERGETVANDPGGKLAAARHRETVKFAVFMDDKIVSIEMSWALIRESSETGIAAFIVGYMQEHHAH